MILTTACKLNFDNIFRLKENNNIFIWHKKNILLIPTPIVIFFNQMCVLNLCQNEFTGYLALGMIISLRWGKRFFFQQTERSFLTSLVEFNSIQNPRYY